MKQFIEDFKKFAIRGNVVDLAVAVVIGGAFGKIVTSLVENIITPLIGVLLGGIDFTNLAVSVGSANVQYGRFVQNVFDFAIIAFVIFVVIRLLARLQKKDEEKPKADPIPSEEVLLLREIRDSVKRTP